MFGGVKAAAVMTVVAPAMLTEVMSVRTLILRRSSPDEHERAPRSSQGDWMTMMLEAMCDDSLRMHAMIRDGGVCVQKMLRDGSCS